jgi:rubrerythrin
LKLKFNIGNHSADRSMKRPFESLTAQEALHVAIFIEERNAQIYQQFSELFAEFRDPDSLQIAQVFWEMGEEERRHGTMLQERYFDRYGTQSCAVTEEDIREMIEVPKIDNGELFAITRARISPQPAHKALQIALEAELAAQRFYKRVREQTSDPDLKKLYSELADFEDNHTELLQKKLAEAPMPPSSSDQS